MKESDDNVAGSDYSQTKCERDSNRARRSSKGHWTSDTKDEDEQEDIELQDEVVDESDRASPSTQPQRRKTKRPAVDKGKGKASSASGPLPNGAKEEAQEFGLKVMETADELATKWNTSRRSILFAASLMLRESRGANAFNKHSAWYAAKFPKAPGGEPVSALSILLLNYFVVKASEYKHAILEDYRRRTVGKSEEEKATSMQEIWEWADSQSSFANVASLKSVTARMMSTQKQLTTLVRI